MEIFKHYKLKKKQKIEQKINNIILFNKWKIQCYKEYPEEIKPPIKEFSDSTGMARFYFKDTWEYFKKYNVNKDLFDKQLQSLSRKPTSFKRGMNAYTCLKSI